jgi:hypothetical protein
MRAALLAVLLLAAASCFSKPRPECALRCGDDDACPADYRCVADGWCKRNDVAEGFVCETGSNPAIDASPIDAPIPSDGELPDGASAIDAAPGSPDAAPADAAPADATI